MTDNRNPYIEQGIDQGAMAYNDHFFEDMIEKLDDVLADTLAPVQDQIEQGLDYHGGA